MRTLSSLISTRSSGQFLAQPAPSTAAISQSCRWWASIKITRSSAESRVFDGGVLAVARVASSPAPASRQPR